MKNAKLISIISIVIAVALIACCFLLHFKKIAGIDASVEVRVNLNESFNVKDVEKIFKEAGATSCIVTAQVHAHDDGFHQETIADILFTAEDPEAVCTKASELLDNKYFLNYDETEYSVFSTFSRTKTVAEYWPAFIVLAVLLVYMFFRFGLKYALAALFAFVEASGINAGIIALTGIRLTSFSIGVFMASGALALVFALAFAVIAKDNKKKFSNDEALAVSTKLLNKLAIIVCSVAAIGICMLLIFGGSLLQNMALTALIGVVINVLIALFAIPATVKAFGKAK